MRLVRAERGRPQGQMLEFVGALDSDISGALWVRVIDPRFALPNGVKQLQVIDVVKQWIDQASCLTTLHRRFPRH